MQRSRQRPIPRLPWLSRSSGGPLAIAALTFATLVHAAESPDAILKRTRATYAALASYSDTGVVTVEYGSAAAPSKDRHTFTTYFERAPRHFLFDFHKAGGDHFVIWGDPAAFHTWWKETAVTADFPNPNNVPAINLSDFQTSGSATKIPTLLYPKAPLVGALSHFADPQLDGTEAIGGRACYRLLGHTSDLYGQTGKEVNLRRLTLWIDTGSSLIRQIREEARARPGEISRTTTTFDPIANPRLNASRFQFTPPQPQ
jgi:outer membrane lipoprotein-sorting protein